MNGLDPRMYVLYFEHDFAKDGGAVGNITLRGGGLPTGAVVHGGIIRVVTSYTGGGGATVALKLVGAADVLAATAVGSLAAGLVDVVPDRTAAKAIVTLTTAKVVATVANAALTAGKLRGALFYSILNMADYNPVSSPSTSVSNSPSPSGANSLSSSPSGSVSSSPSGSVSGSVSGSPSASPSGE